MVRIYTDTNVLRYFGTAFAEARLPDDLQMQHFFTHQLTEARHDKKAILPESIRNLSTLAGRRFSEWYAQKVPDGALVSEFWYLVRSRHDMSIQLVENQMLHFLSTTEPEVLCLSGHWGVGKTYAWNKYTKDALSNDGIALKRYS
jgi:hypothetical protein